MAQDSTHSLEKQQSPLSFVAAGQSLIKDDLRTFAAPGFKAVQEFIQDSDAALTNYEGTISGTYGGWPTKAQTLHVSAPVVFDVLRELGFNMLALSNNHAFDLGPNGILSTLEEVRKRDFLAGGIGNNLTEAAQPSYRDTAKGKIALISIDCGPQPDYVYALNGTAPFCQRPGVNRQKVRVTLGVEKKSLELLQQLSEQLGHEFKKKLFDQAGYQARTEDAFDFYGLRFKASETQAEIRELDQQDLDRNLQSIRQAKQNARFVFVYVHHHHWQPLWELVPHWMVSFSHLCIDEGATAFISHGVPLLQAIEIYRQRPIFYSLGNFIFHTFRASRYSNDRIWQSVLARCSFSEAGELIQMELAPIVLGGEQAMVEKKYHERRAPFLAQGDYGGQILQHLAKLSAPYGTTIRLDHDRGFIEQGS